MRRLVDERVSMKHGAGGRAMRRLIENVFATGLYAGCPDQMPMCSVREKNRATVSLVKSSAPAGSNSSMSATGSTVGAVSL